MDSRSRLVVLSVDGMHPDFYRRPQDCTANVPNIQRLVAEGASADAVETIYPSTTYPAHATIVTGVHPRRHGIYSHLASLDPTERARPWNWFARGIAVPTLWDLAAASGRTSAAVSWPVSAGARIDWNIPEIWDPAVPDPMKDFSTAARYSSPGVFEEVVSAISSRYSQSGDGGTAALARLAPDKLRADAALELWRCHNPDLLLVHFVGYDAVAHQFGPRAPESLKMLEETDVEIGRIYEAVADECTTFVVLSDHGFVSVEQDVAPLVVFSERELFGRSYGGKLELRSLGAVHCGGSFAVYWLEPPDTLERQELKSAIEEIAATGALAGVMDQEKLESLGADPDAEVILDAGPGFSLSGRCSGDLVKPAEDRGTHGQLPSVPGMAASFIAAGQGIRSGKNLGRIPLTALAPLLASRMSLNASVLASETEPPDLS